MKYLKMKVNVDMVNEIVKKRYRNNKTWFAEELGLETSYVNQILNKKVRNDGPKFIKHFIKYCEKNNINPKEYIFLG